MIIKKKVRVVNEVVEEVLVHKMNAKQVLKHISTSNPYYKFVKALSQGKNVLCQGNIMDWYNFDLDPSEYSIEEPFNSDDWKLVLIRWNHNSNFVLYRTHKKNVSYFNDGSYHSYKFINNDMFSSQEIQSLPIEK